MENVSNLIQNRESLVSNTADPRITAFRYNTDEMPQEIYIHWPRVKLVSLYAHRFATVPRTYQGR